LLTEEGQSYYLDLKELFSSDSRYATRSTFLSQRSKSALTVALRPSFAIQWLVLDRISALLFNKIQISMLRIKAVDLYEGFFS